MNFIATLIFVQLFKHGTSKSCKNKFVDKPLSEIIPAYFQNNKTNWEEIVTHFWRIFLRKLRTLLDAAIQLLSN